MHLPAAAAIAGCLHASEAPSFPCELISCMPFTLPPLRLKEVQENSSKHSLLSERVQGLWESAWAAVGTMAPQLLAVCAMKTCGLTFSRVRLEMGMDSR